MMDEAALESSSGILIAACMVAILAGCATGPDSSPTADQLLELYAERLEDLSDRRDPDGGILDLTVTGPEALVNLEVRNAALGDVLRRLLDASGAPYRITGPEGSVRVSESLHRIPLEQACRNLLAARGGRCARTDGTYIVELPGAGAPDQYPADDAALVVARVQLRNLTSSRAATLLEGLYPASHEEPSPVHFAVDAATNTVALTGTAEAVRRATGFLGESDVDLPHVLIEANIFAVQSSELERLGAQLSGSSGAFTDVTINFASLLSGGLRFSRLAGADSVTAFTAMIDVLLATESAHVIARPFIGVVSGEQASIAVTNDRQVAVLSEGGITPVTTTVSSGVQLDFGAVARPGGMIRLEIGVEESTFVPTVEGAVSEVARARAKTVMEVPDGQSVIIGGMALQRASNSRVGLPWLREIPVLGLLFGGRGATRKDAQLIVVITPRLWTPGMDHPPPLAAESAGEHR